MIEMREFNQEVTARDEKIYRGTRKKQEQKPAPGQFWSPVYVESQPRRLPDLSQHFCQIEYSICTFFLAQS
jgi:hypothetical protein